MGERDIEKNFEDLTKVRWIVDPLKGEIPIIVFVNYHYSKNLEKEFRAVLGMTMFLGFGAEEYTNIDTIMPKRSSGRQTLEYFSRMVDRMFTSGKFSLLHSNGQVIEYGTDKPCRPSCAVLGKDARIILMAKEDQCQKCSKGHFKKFADPKRVVDRAIKAYGTYGKKALKQALYKRGYYLFHPKLNTAIEFLENRVFVEFDCRFDQLAEEVEKFEYSDKKLKTYHKRKEEEAAIEELNITAEVLKVEKEPRNYEDDDLDGP
jgi:hypothetical protein